MQLRVVLQKFLCVCIRILDCLVVIVLKLCNSTLPLLFLKLVFLIQPGFILFQLSETSDIRSGITCESFLLIFRQTSQPKINWVVNSNASLTDLYEAVVTFALKFLCRFSILASAFHIISACTHLVFISRKGFSLEFSEEIFSFTQCPQKLVEIFFEADSRIQRQGKRFDTIPCLKYISPCENEGRSNILCNVVVFSSILDLHYHIMRLQSL